MRTRTSIGFVAVSVSVSWALGVGVARADDGGRKPEAGSLAPPFVLEDADGAKHDLAAMKGQHVLLLFGNRSQKDENDKWAQAFSDCLGHHGDVRVFAVADMRGIPFFVTTNFVRAQIRKDKRSVPLLLDWKQQVNKRYGINPERLELVAIGPDGKVTLRHQNSAYDAGGFKEVLVLLGSVAPSLVSAREAP